MEKISVIIPVYNVEKYICNCIESVLNQTYKNLEIILVDDGSTDNSSGSICDEYAKKDQRIQVVHKKNGGLSDARNVALEKVTGDYIGFVDSDDVISLDFYEYLYNLIKQDDYDIAECEFFRISSDDIEKTLEILKSENLKIDIRTKEQTREEALKIFYGKYASPYVNKVVVWNKLYKKEIFENLRFATGKFHEDEAISYKILSKVRKEISSNKKMYGYIQSPNSIMRRNISLKQMKDNLEAYSDATEYFKSEPQISSKCARRYLENCLEIYYKINKNNESEEDKKEKNIVIGKMFEKFYNDYIDLIEKNIETEEKEILDIIKIAYKVYETSKDEEINLEQYFNDINIIQKKQPLKEKPF